MSICAKTFVAALCLAALNVTAASAQAKLSACSKVKDQYSCNKPQVAKALVDARTVAVESHPFNKVSEKALADLARDLGKNVQSDSVDLVFVLEPAGPDGIYFGPNDKELATLRVFTRGPNGQRGQLLWVETLTGQPGKPWLMVVHDLVQQFKAEFK
jgi:hypothetical protein